MITFTLPHILVLHVLIKYEIKSSTALHYIFFLASANSSSRDELGFYDFTKSKTGVYSKLLNLILTTFNNHKFISLKNFSVTDEGREIYYQLGAALRSSDRYINNIDLLHKRVGSFEETKLLKELYSTLIYRKCRPGFNVFPKELKKYY